jgi:hypothetical protein
MFNAILRAPSLADNADKPGLHHLSCLDFHLILIRKNQDYIANRVNLQSDSVI